MARARLVFILLICCFYVNCEVNVENSANLYENYQSEITSVLSYLNSTPVKVYNYKQAYLLNAHTKADIIELTIEVSVDCINKYPELPCTEKFLICNAFVRKNVDGVSHVLNNVQCKPKPEIVVEEDYVPPSVNPTWADLNETKSIALSNEAVSSEVGEHYVAIRRDSVPCLGCPFDLNPNAEGVDDLVNLALTHIDTERPTKQALVKVHKLQQQVVNGVKYILLVEISPTTCPKNSNQQLCPLDSDLQTSICQITYLHKPWISKSKHIIHNNCTISQEFVITDPHKDNDINNAININEQRPKPSFAHTPNFDHIAESGTIEEMTPFRLEDLESQIILESETMKVDDSLPPPTAEANIVSIPLYIPEEETTPITIVEDEVTNIVKERKKRAIPQLEKITPEEKSLVKNLADYVASALDNIDDDNNKRLILQILGAKKMVGDDGVYYHLILRMGISHCLEDNPNKEHCREKLFENYTKICKVQVYVNDDIVSPRIVKSQCQNIKRDKNESNRTNYSRFKRHTRLGGAKEIDKQSDKVGELVRYSLMKLDSESSHTKKYKAIEVLSATSQTVAGRKYKIKTKISLSDCEKNDSRTSEECNLLEGATPKICDLIIWEKAWMNFRRTTIQCDDDGDKIFKFESNLRRKRQVMPGGILDIKNDDAEVLENLEQALTHLDGQSSHPNKLKVMEVLSASNQLVAGTLHRIKAKVVLSDCKKIETKQRQDCGTLAGEEGKICNFEIWNRAWLSNGRQTKINCEGEIHLFRSKRDNEDYEEISRFLFQKFINKFNKTYSNRLEHQYRFKVFSENLKRIRDLNSYEQGTARYGVTQFADLTEKEFSKSHGLRNDLRNENAIPFAQAQIPDIELPQEFDWRTKDVVTKVKNQEQCGSCWAFSVTGNVEGQYSIKHGKLLEFSEQELVDCDTDDDGCNGGLMDNAYRAIEKMGGLETEQNYPYDAKDETCHFKKNLTEVQLTGALNISQNEVDMAKWLVKNGPISIAINANAMQFYFGGISHPFKFLCNPKNLDHGVLIVGYGVHTYPMFNKTLPYWIVKNSWGSEWGEQGYYRVYRGDGTCGLNQTPSSAIVA